MGICIFLCSDGVFLFLNYGNWIWSLGVTYKIELLLFWNFCFWLRFFVV